MMKIQSPDHLKEELFIFLCLIMVTGVADMLTGRPLHFLISGLLGYLGWHLYNLAHLSRLLREDTIAGLPRSAGLWKDVHAEILDSHKASRQHKRVLSYSVNRFRDAVSALPDAVVILDQHGAIEWSNPAAETLFGISVPGASGQVFATLINDPTLDEYLTTGNFTQPLVLAAPGNRTKIISLLITPLDKQHQQMIVANDISRKYYLDEVKRDFVANVSHELRTPLTVISGLLEQMDMGDMDDATQKRAVELMQQQAIRMSELVSDLLTLSRLESETSSIRDEKVPVPELLASIIEEARTLSGTTGHVIQLKIQSPNGLLGNMKELRTAFSNLITNAIQHTPDRAEARVNWLVDSAGAHLSVNDTGEGIPARHIPRLTERLYRVDASRSRDSGGTGLGLAIVKHVLDHHNAKLEINSDVGRGSTFICHFPIKRITAPKADQNITAAD